MERTAERLRVAAYVAEKAAQEGGADMKALYVMSAADVVKSASSQPQPAAISESEAYKAASSKPTQWAMLSCILIAYAQIVE